MERERWRERDGERGMEREMQKKAEVEQNEREQLTGKFVVVLQLYLMLRFLK